MKNKFLHSVIYIVGIIVGMLTVARAQQSSNTVKYKITFDASTQTYTTWVIPDYALPNANNTGATEKGGTAQFTIVVPKDFNITQITDIKGTWTKPGEGGFLKLGPGNPGQSWPNLDPTLNYYVIGKTPSETDYGVFAIGVPVPLFSFKGNGCFGTLKPLPANDPFITAADNAYSLNVGNSFYSRSGQAAGGNVVPLEQFVNITGAAVNCFFIANPDSKTANSTGSTSISILPNDKSGDGTVATISNVTLPTITSPPTKGTATVKADGTIDYLPNPGASGTDILIYEICDKFNPTVCDTAAVTITLPIVILPNHPPVVIGKPIVVKPGEPVQVCMPITEPNATDTHTVTVCSTPAKGTVTASIDNSTHQLCVNYTAGQTPGTELVCIIVCDNGNPSKCDTINLPVTIIDITPTPGPAAPIVIPTPIVTEPGTPITVCMPIIDTPADTHTGTICNPVSAKGSTYFAVDNTNHTVCFTYRPAPGMVGKDEICMIICDQTNKCDTVKIPVTINPPIGPPTSNQPPVVVPTPIVTESNKPVTICTSIQDPNTSDTHTSVLCSTPLNGSATTSINNTTNQVCVTYSPKPNFSGNDEVCIIVCDQTGRCDTIKFPITVKPVVVLKRPTIYAYDDNNITTKTASVSGNVLINDDIATGTLPLIVNTVPVTQPMYGTVTLDANGRYTYTPNGTYVGIDTFKYQVCDNNRAASCDTATVTINIIDFSTTSNNPPIALGDNLSTRENIIVSGNVLSNDRDPDSGQTLTVSLVNGPTNGQLTLNPDGTYTYKPNPGFVGNDKFTYKVCDNGTPQMCSNAIVDLNVYGANVINLPPIANADLFFRCPTCSATGTILTNDSDPEGGVLVLNTMPITPPSNGSVSINSNGTFTYTPNPGFTGPDKFVYEVCDNYSPKLCSQAVVFIIPKNNVIGNADLSISKTVIGPKNREINDLITYKIVVRNLGPDAATNVIVKDSVTTSLVLMSGTTTNGTFSSPLWSISSIASGDSAILTVTAKVIAEGVSFNYAIIKNSDQIDNNKINNTTNSCISVPYKLCSGQLIEVSVPSNYLNVVWRDAQGNVVPSVGNNVSLTKAGVYSFSASNNTCPNGGCCPVIVVDSNDCCPANLCIPFTVQKKRR